MRNNSLPLFVAGLLSLLLCSSGCVTVYQSEVVHSAPAPSPMTVWAIYLPTPQIPPNGTIRPIPAHQGWTNLRMERDLTRMADANVTAALVVTTNVQLLDEVFRERYRQFAELAEKHSIKVALLLCTLTQPAPAIDRKNITQFLVDQQLIGFSSCLREAHGAPVLVIAEDFELDAPVPELDNTICLLQLGHELPSRPTGTLEIDAMAPNSAGVLWIRAADNSGCAPMNRARPTDDWTIRRRKGAYLKQQLEHARDVGAKVLLLDSWNDYTRGSFVENNSLDQDAFLKILKNR